MASDERKPLVVLYASQTGTAEGVAAYVARQAERRNFDVSCMAVDDYDRVALATQGYAVFVIATTGDGEVPDNMQRFWRFLLRKTLPPDCLSALNFAVFGLGDSAYAQFNAAARRLRVRLTRLGASELTMIGLGDEQDSRGHVTALTPWLANVWEQLLTRCPLPAGFVIDDSPRLPTPRFDVTWLADGDKKAADGDCEPAAAAAAAVKQLLYDSRPFGAVHDSVIMADLVANHRMTAADWEQDVRSVQLDMREHAVSYSAGDVALLFYRNGSVADEFASLMGFDPAATIVLHDTLTAVDHTLTVSALFRNYCDILATPRRFDMELMSLFAEDEEERDKLLELSTNEGTDLLYDYVTREKRSYVEIFQDFPSCRPPLQMLLAIIPPLRPRSFSIASSAAVHASILQLCIAIVRYKTYYKRTRTGVFSSWLAAADAGEEAPVALWIKRGGLRLPAIERPLILVGPGTGVAPMRALLEERRLQLLALRDSGGEEAAAAAGATHLYFGCRHEDKDFLFGAELRAWEEEGWLQLHTAFSRDSPPRKVYVQHLLAKQKDLLELLGAGDALLFICGAAKDMPDGVKDAIVERLVEEEGATEEQGKAFVKLLARKRQLQLDCWS